MTEYICRRQAISAEYSMNRPIYKLCTMAGRILGLDRLIQWWDQDLNPGKESDGASKGAEKDAG